MKGKQVARDGRTVDDDWMKQAACAALTPEQASRYFYPQGNSKQYEKDIEAGKQICARCPVLDSCLRHALEKREDHGTWGGQTEWDRKGSKRSTKRTIYTKTCGYQPCSKNYDTYQGNQLTCSRRCSALLQSSQRRDEREMAS